MIGKGEQPHAPKIPLESMCRIIFRTYAIVTMGRLVRDTKSLIFRFKFIEVSHTLR
jgi:hypothetical protein